MNISSFDFCVIDLRMGDVTQQVIKLLKVFGSSVTLSNTEIYFWAA
jgi:hypothetical protein